jgi:acyl carrier protein phosphodiesterase
MNYLAHLLLSDHSEESLLGNFLGDFVKGEIGARYSSAIARGILLHRKIDRFADAHPLTKTNRRLFSPQQRRFAGIILDICYDHFLSVHWPEYSTIDLDLFIRQAYSVLEKNRALLPDRLQAILPRMIRQNWLGCYRSLEGVELTLARISRRISRESHLRDSIIEIKHHYAVLESNFCRFFPELIEFAKAYHQKDIG